MKEVERVSLGGYAFTLEDDAARLAEEYLGELEKYYDGMLLRIPSLKNPDQLGEITTQDKMFDIFKEHHRWQEILGIRTVGDFNQAIEAGHANI